MNHAHVKLLALAGLIALGGLGCSDKQDETVHRERKTHSEPAPADSPSTVAPTAPKDSLSKPTAASATEPATAKPATTTP